LKEQDNLESCPAQNTKSLAPCNYLLQDFHLFFEHSPFHKDFKKALHPHHTCLSLHEFGNCVHFLSAELIPAVSVLQPYLALLLFDCISSHF
jgi:hypothetical protein